MPGPKLRLSAHNIRRVAVLACCDHKTVRAYLDGKSQYSTTRERIANALRELGFKLPDSSHA